ncbi:MAG: hypothetical protein SVK54_00265 [candidate division WOR-3 bacterium]|nr:hypothetical protein [candidate division WOR-3 bacterium]
MILSIVFYTITIIYSLMSVFYFITADSFSFSASDYFLVFLAGGTVFLILRIFVKKISEFFEFIETFTHEYTHLIFSFITFTKVYSFHSTMKSGGEIKTSRINPLIALAPYTVPLPVIIVGILFLLIKDIYYLPACFIAGAFYFQFLYIVIADLRVKNQPDLKKYGYLLSLTLILFSISFFSIIIYILLNYSPSLLIDIPVETFSRVMESL